ncbi:hypothetical protein AB0L13_09480 [Saccharopolyspora shandongensis]|uniref:hypothetical protein n=1 Tax=Saccharopolyspora shandongensis TaxID=418495 RepID=UPI00343D9E00
MAEKVAVLLGACQALLEAFEGFVVQTQLRAGTLEVPMRTGTGVRIIEVVGSVCAGFPRGQVVVEMALP